MGVRERGVSAEQAVAYRVAAHNLHQMLPADGLLDGPGVVGVQDTPPGNAGVALANRVAKLTPDDLEGALHDDRTLVRILSMRGAAHLVPRRDVTVFGPGALASGRAVPTSRTGRPSRRRGGRRARRSARSSAC